jgi:hypothetical protein
MTDISAYEKNKNEKAMMTYLRSVLPAEWIRSQEEIDKIKIASGWSEEKSAELDALRLQFESNLRKALCHT